MPSNIPLHQLEVQHLECLSYNITVIHEPSLLNALSNDTDLAAVSNLIEFNETTREFILKRLPRNKSFGNLILN